MNDKIEQIWIFYEERVILSLRERYKCKYSRTPRFHIKFYSEN